MNKGTNPYGIGVNLNGAFFNVGSITPAGDLSWAAAQNNAAGGSYFGVPGAKFDGVTDDSAFINTRINEVSTAGGGTLYFPAGTSYIASPLLLKSKVKIVGASNGTTLSCAGVCVGQAANSFVSQAQFINFNLSMKAGNTSDAILVTALQDSDIGGIKVSGSGFGSVLKIESTAATGGSDNTPGNTIFNNFHDIDAWGATSTYGVYVAGRYGAAPPLPAQVVTLNDFRNIKVFATNACFDFMKAADSNSVYNPTCRLGLTGARAFVDADDPAYSGVNNYVNNQRYYSPVITAPFTGTYTYFAGNWTFGVEAYGMLQDINPVTNTITPVNYGTATSYCIRGQNIRPDGLAPGSGNLLLGDYCKGYYGKDSWVNVAAAEGFSIASTVTSPYNYLLLQPATSLFQGTVNLPCGSADGAVFSLASTQLINRVTLSPCSGDNVSVGDNPLRLSADQTVKIKYIQSNGYWVTDAAPTSVNGNWLNYTPTTGFSLGSSSLTNYSFLLVNPATDLASGTVQLPCSRKDSNEFTISTLKRITALTVTGCSSPADSVALGVANPFWIDAGGTVTLTYLEASSTWVPKNTSSGLGNLAVAGGGTGLTQGTSGGVPYFASTSTMASSAALGSTQVVLGGGAGAAPYTLSSFTSDGSGNVAVASLSATSRVNVAASVPTISSCGTSPPAATAGSSNNAGQFTLGTGTPTACTVTFASAYTNYAYCTVTAASSYAGTYYLTGQDRTKFTVNLSAGTDSVVFNYTCFGN